MASTRVPVRVYQVTMAEPATSQWCPVCLLPSVTVHDIALLLEITNLMAITSRVQVQRYLVRQCDNHGGARITRTR